MANLAIKGHATRGKEVIEILKILGGKNQKYVYSGKDTLHYYFIDNETGDIRAKLYTDNCWTKVIYIIFTLEEFLEKYPYKVGDKILVKPYIGAREICEVRWEDDCIKYGIGVGEWFTVDKLQPYKEKEPMEEQKLIPPYMDYDVRTSKEETMDKTFENILGTLSSYLRDFLSPKGVDKAIKYIRENMEEYSKPQYPQSYEECCEVLGCNIGITMKLGIEEDEKLFSLLYMLKTCRNAYWKLYGEQTGLGKPWEPDWKDGNTKYIITFAQNEVYKDVSFIFNHFLAFPTEEMRDAFYESFKELIETCKEFL